MGEEEVMTVAARTAVFVEGGSRVLVQTGYTAGVSDVMLHLGDEVTVYMTHEAAARIAEAMESARRAGVIRTEKATAATVA